MKIRKSQLRQIIQEEFRRLTVEADTAVPVGDMTHGEYFVYVNALPGGTGLAELIDGAIIDGYIDEDLEDLKRELRQHRNMDKAGQAEALARFIERI